MGADAECFLESIYDSVIETKNCDSDAQMTKNDQEEEESKDEVNSLV